MGDVPQIVAREGGMSAPRTCTEYLVEGKVLLIQQGRSEPSSFTGTGSRDRRSSARLLIGQGNDLPDPEGDGVFGDLLPDPTCGDEQAPTLWAVFSRTSEIEFDCSYRAKKSTVR